MQPIIASGTVSWPASGKQALTMQTAKPYAGFAIALSCLAGEWTGGSGTLTVAINGEDVILDAERTIPVLGTSGPRLWYFPYIAETRPIFTGPLSVELNLAPRVQITPAVLDEQGNIVTPEQTTTLAPVPGSGLVQVFGVEISLLTSL